MRLNVQGRPRGRATSPWCGQCRSRTDEVQALPYRVVVHAYVARPTGGGACSAHESCRGFGSLHVRSAIMFRLGTRCAATYVAASDAVTPQCESQREGDGSSRVATIADDTWYEREMGTTRPVARPSLPPESDTDVVVIGGGFAGLHIAIELAERGRQVTVLEAQRLGSGASGRCGGFVLSSFQVDWTDLIDLVGVEHTSTLYHWICAAAKKVLSRAVADCGLQASPTLAISRFKMSVTDQCTVASSIDKLNAAIGTRLEYWSPEMVHASCASDAVHHAILDPTSFVVNPLQLVYGLADALERAGGTIHEVSEVIQAEQSKTGRWYLHTANGGTIEANEVVLAVAHAPEVQAVCDSGIERATVGVYTAIGVTEQLTEEQRTLFNHDLCVYDDLAELNYFRVVDGGARLLWGSIYKVYPVDRKAACDILQQNAAQVFPQLRGVKMEHIWGGMVSSTWDMMPLVGNPRPGLWYCTAFGGTGIVATALGAELVVEGICGETERWKLMNELFPSKFIGGCLRTPAAQMYLWTVIAFEKIRLWLTDIT